MSEIFTTTVSPRSGHSVDRVSVPSRPSVDELAPHIVKPGRQRNRHSLWPVTAAFALAGMVMGCMDHSPAPIAAASVSLVNTSGVSVGNADLSQTGDGMVIVTVVITSGLSAGVHGIHFHEVGVADPKATPAFSTSGEHYNPDNLQHGLENPQGAHTGDLPNIVIDSQGKGTLVTTTDRITLTDGPKSLFDANGSSLIIHAGTDDQKTDPSGNSGGRIAGGVVVRK